MNSRAFLRLSWAAGIESLPRIGEVTSKHRVIGELVEVARLPKVNPLILKKFDWREFTQGERGDSREFTYNPTLVPGMMPFYRG